MSRQHPKVPLQQTILPRRWLKSASRFRPLLETLEDRTVPADFFNTNPIVIPSSGAASPYPSAITVTGMSGNITDVNVTLNNFSHTWTNDVDILLVSPTGQKLMLMSDVGGSASLSGLTITLDDAAASNLPGSAFGSGTYRPTNIADGSGDDIFPAPAPAAPYGSTLSIFNGFAANGTWSLFVRDDVGGLSGSIAGGWKLSVFTGAPPSDVPDTIGTALNTGMGPGAGTYTNTTVIGDGTFTTRDVDMYAFQATAGQTLVASTAFPGSGTSMDTYLRLFNAAGTQLAFNDDFTGLYSQITFTIPTTATYYIGVSGFSNSAYNPNSGGSGIAGSTGDYRLTLTTTTTDVPDTIGTALNTGMGPGAGTYTNTTVIGDGTFTTRDVDMYAFQATAGQTLVASTAFPGSGTSMDTILRLFNAAGTQLAFNDDFTGLYSQITFTIPTTATYYIGVSGFSNTGYNPNSGGSGIAGSTGDYRLTLTTTGTSSDVPDTIGTALNTGMGPGAGSYINNSQLGDGSFGVLDVDMYAFQATAGQQLTAQTLSTGGSDADTILRLFNAGGTQLAVDDDGNGFPYSRITFTIPTTGTYYIGVSGYSNFGYNPNSGGSGTTGSTGAYRLSLATVVVNVPPSNVIVTPPGGGFLEGTSGTINVSFTDPDVADAHTIDIDWDNNGTFDETFGLAAGFTSFTRNHIYTDDGISPGNGSAFDPVTIVVRVADAGGNATGSGNSTINNVIPNTVTITNGAFSINENGSFTLNGSFIDAGTLDVHTVDIDWNGDGSFDQSVVLATGARTFSFTSPVYADDNPSGTPFDTNNVNVRVRDDDTGVSTTATSTVTVNNVAPSAVTLDGPYSINENGSFTLNGSFIDPGTLDVHTVDIDWNGDGSFDQSVVLATGARNFSINSPVYTDDNPSGTPFDTNNVNVRVRDDDTGVSTTATSTVTVNNVAPSAVTLDGPYTINENDSFTLNGSFIDPGLQDSHIVDVDWNGDGSFDQSVVLATGARNFSITSPVYTDDNPSGTPFDTNNVNVRVRDDDTGVSTTATSTVTVNNVAPSAVTILNGPFSINENDSFTLNGSFIDPGTLDVHTVDIDWDGDGSFEQSVTLAVGARTFSFTSPVYADDNPSGTPFDTNNVNVRVRDDDTGVSTTVTSTVTVNNVAPSAVTLDGPYSINENGSFTLNGSFIDPGTLDVHTVEVDWNGDGSYDQSVTLTTGDRTFSITSPIYVDDNPTGTAFDTNAINVRVSDDDTSVGLGGSTLTVNNVAPTITAITPTAGVDGSGNAVACNPVTFQIDLSDPSLAASETFRYEVDWDGNGTVDEIFPTAGFTASRSISLTHEFDVTTTFRVRGVDDDTGVGAWTSYTIPVITIAIVDGNLVVAGSNVADSITINTYTAGSATVTRNGVNSTWALPTGARIVVRGCAGNDVIAVNGAVSAELYGGAGNDVMYGGSGQDMLWGEDGNDTLSLGAGNDVAIGGLGRDLLYGGNGNDILLGGAIDPLNYTWASLQSASAAWNSYVGVPPSVPPEVLALMAATTDPNDVNNYDRFWGNAGKDAFVYRTSGTLDQINDYKASEFDGLAGF